MKQIQVRRSEEHNRTLIFSGLPKQHPNDLEQLKIHISYATDENDGGRTGKAVTLDGIVIPAIHRAFDVARRATALLDATIATRPDYRAKGLVDYDLAWEILHAYRSVLNWRNPTPQPLPTTEEFEAAGRELESDVDERCRYCGQPIGTAEGGVCDKCVKTYESV